MAKPHFIKRISRTEGLVFGSVSVAKMNWCPIKTGGESFCPLLKEQFYCEFSYSKEKNRVPKQCPLRKGPVTVNFELTE